MRIITTLTIVAAWIAVLLAQDLITLFNLVCQIVTLIESTLNLYSKPMPPFSL